MTESHIIGCNTFGNARVVPRLFAHNIVLRRVQPHYRRKHTKLNPPAIQLIVLAAVMMSAYVMTPPRITAVGCCRSKIWLKL